MAEVGVIAGPKAQIRGRRIVRVWQISNEGYRYALKREENS